MERDNLDRGWGRQDRDRTGRREVEALPGLLGLRPPHGPGLAGSFCFTSATCGGESYRRAMSRRQICSLAQFQQ